jgi:hypothetical protein
MIQNVNERGAPASTEVRTLGELSPRQWKSGLAAWLGWMFEGLDMNFYTLVAAPFVAGLLAAGCWFLPIRLLALLIPELSYFVSVVRGPIDELAEQWSPGHLEQVIAHAELGRRIALAQLFVGPVQQCRPGRSLRLANAL